MAAFHVEIEHADELAVGAGVGDQRLAPAVFNDARRRYPVMGVAAEDGVDAAHAGRHFQIDIHAVMRQHDHDLRSRGAGGVDRLLHVVFLDAEGPVGDHVARMGDGRVGEGLADHRNLDAIDLAQDIWLEHRIAEIGGFDVLRDNVDMAGEILFGDFLHAVLAIGAFPVQRHDVHAEQLGRLDHVLPLRPHRGARPLPGIAAIQQ